MARFLLSAERQSAAAGVLRAELTGQRRSKGRRRKATGLRGAALRQRGCQRRHASARQRSCAHRTAHDSSTLDRSQSSAFAGHLSVRSGEGFLRMFDSTGLAARRRLGALALISALALAACGGDDDTDGGGQGPDNRAPTLNGLPATSVVAGDDYLFQPTASEPDGDTLLFGVDGLPPWAEFDAVTGTLSGTPNEEHVGTYRGVVVWVTDGEAETLLPAFDIVVEPHAPTGNTPPSLSGTPASSV